PPPPPSPPPTPPPGFQPPPPPSGFQPPPAPQSPPPHGYYAAPQTNSKAIIALILAIVGYFLGPCGIVIEPIALVLASSARAEIRRPGAFQSGDGLVTATQVIA